MALVCHHDVMVSLNPAVTYIKEKGNETVMFMPFSKALVTEVK